MLKIKKIIELLIPAILSTFGVLSAIIIVIGIWTFDLLLILGGVFFLTLVTTILIESVE